MPVPVDTNVLIFSIQQGHPWQEACIRAMELLLAADEPVYVFLQNLAEFWNVCTRPADKNGLGLSPQDAEKQLNQLDAILTVLHDTPAVCSQWRKLIIQHDVKGIQAHAARIAAAMQVHRVNRLLTYNPRDFQRSDGITPVVSGRVGCVEALRAVTSERPADLQRLSRKRRRGYGPGRKWRTEQARP